MTRRFGIIGSGMIAPIHLAAIRALAGAQATGIMDHGSGRGREIAPELDTSGSDDLDVFIARDDIDIITVATPSGLHHEAVMKAAAAGKHCIVEKPIDIRLRRVDEMIAAHPPSSPSTSPPVSGAHPSCLRSRAVGRVYFQGGGAPQLFQLVVSAVGNRRVGPKLPLG